MPFRTPRRKPEQKTIALDSSRDYATCAARLKALADLDRLRIVMRLLKSELSVSALAAELDAPIDKISHHLGVLRSANLVQARKQGKFVIYSLGSEIMNAVGLMEAGKTVDLGCCQLDVVQPTSAGKTKQSSPRKASARKA